MVFNIIKQILALIGTAIAIGIILTIFGINIYLGIVAGIALQFIIYNGFRYVVDSLVLIKMRQQENEKLRELSKQVAEVTCPCGQQSKEVVPIRIDRPTDFKCKKCNKNIAVYTTIETAVITEPIANTDLSSIETIIENKLNESTGKY